MNAQKKKRSLEIPLCSVLMEATCFLCAQRYLGFSDVYLKMPFAYPVFRGFSSFLEESQGRIARCMQIHAYTSLDMQYSGCVCKLNERGGREVDGQVGGMSARGHPQAGPSGIRRPVRTASAGYPTVSSSNKRAPDIPGARPSRMA